MRNPFAGIAQVILWSVLFLLTAIEYVAQIVMCGHFEWWIIGAASLPILTGIGLHLVWKEYKEDK